ncbi:MAG: right-handed parallel beta-helix repeat-containing protein [Ruminococcus sp.]|nr:right-handed parallel beta-helix repeat-containing protein [Ruminococcus sp.]
MVKKAAFLLFAMLMMAVIPSFSVKAAAAEKTINILNYGADGTDNKDDTLAIQKALNAALNSDVPIKVAVPKGRYYVGAPEGMSARSLKIFSNTTLELEEGAVLLRSNESPNVYLLSTSGYSNITIRGGTLSANVQATNRARGIMSLRDVTGLTIEDVDFTGFCGTHAVLLDGAEDLTVRRCNFKGFKNFTGTADEYREQTNSTSYWSSEALHIDFDVDNNRTIKNVSVSDCTFVGCPSGVGTHHVYTGFTGENISIFNNTFVSCYYSACNATNFKNFDFYGNVAINTPTLIHSENVRGKIRDNYSNSSEYSPNGYLIGLIYTFGVNYLDLNTLAPITVSNNRERYSQQLNMTNSASVEVSGNVLLVNNYLGIGEPRECGIKVYQKASANVHDNIISNAPYKGILADDASVNVSSNTLVNCGSGVYLTGCPDAVVSGNKILSPAEKGVDAQGCYGIRIVSNAVSGTGDDAIYMYGGISSGIESNTVTGCSGNGISVQGPQVSRINNNIITEAEGNAVYLSEEALVSEIKGNDLFSNEGYDLSAEQGAEAALFTGNTSDKNEVELIGEEHTGQIDESKVHTHSFVLEKTVWASCNNAGYNVYRCRDCNMRYNTKFERPVSHSFRTYTVEPTYTSGGYTVSDCNLCKMSYTHTFTEAITLNDVSGIRVLATSANAVKITWDKVDNAQGYCVYVYNKSLKKWEHYKNTTGNVMLINKLNPGEAYAFTVRAFKKYGGKTLLSPNFVNFKTSTKPAKLSFTVKSEKAGEAALSWDKVTGATSYAVFYKTATSKWVKIATVNNKTTSYTKTGLKQGGQYYFTVRAYRTYEGVTYGGDFTAKGIKAITAAQQKILDKAKKAVKK